MSESEKRSPLLAVGVALALVLGVVLLLRRGGDNAPPAAASGDAGPSASSGFAEPPVVDRATARREASQFSREAEQAHDGALADASHDLEKALSKDDCVAARKPYDVIKESKPDLTKQTQLVLSQIRMLTSVGAYCNSWSSEKGTRW